MVQLCHFMADDPNLTPYSAMVISCALETRNIVILILNYYTGQYTY